MAPKSKEQLLQEHSSNRKEYFMKIRTAIEGWQYTQKHPEQITTDQFHMLQKKWVELIEGSILNPQEALLMTMLLRKMIDTPKDLKYKSLKEINQKFVEENQTSTTDLSQQGTTQLEGAGKNPATDEGGNSPTC